MNLYDESFALIAYLNKLGVRCAVIGGIAMAFHGGPRFTRDIDVLILLRTSTWFAWRFSAWTPERRQPHSGTRL